MFDARRLLESLVRAAGQPQQQQQSQGSGGLADLLGQLAQGLGQPAGARGAGTGAPVHRRAA